MIGQRFLTGAVLAVGIGFASVPGVVGVAGAQASVNTATRTVTSTSSASVPGVPFQTASTGLTGTLGDFRTLYDANIRDFKVVYHFTFANFMASISGFTDNNGNIAARTTLIFSDGSGFGKYVESLIRTDGGPVDENGLNGNMGIVHNGKLDYATSLFGGYGLSLSTFTNVQNQGNGASANATGTVTLDGVDIMSRDGTQRLGTITFDNLGNGTVVLASTVPEPTSLALLGTGLLGLVPLVRRRRAR